MMIEYENLTKSNAKYFTDLEEAASRVIRSGWYVLGKEVSAFEQSFAQYVGSKHCIGVANGLDALILSIEGLNLRKGSDVLVASNTYIATILSIIKAGHRPVLVEPNLATFNIDPARLASALTPNARAICVTHLFGKACRMEEIGAFARAHGLKLIEDCAQSHGAKLAGKMTGTFGDAGCFSFYPTKNLGALGDSGAIVTDDDELAERLRHLRNYGSKTKYVNDYIGVNSRLDELQAAMLSVKLKHLDTMIEHKRQLASIYLAELPSFVKLPMINEDEFDVFHIFGIRSSRRNELKEFLLINNIKTEIHYPIPPHKQAAMQGLFFGEYPIAQELHDTELSLPISNAHTTNDIHEICKTIQKFES